MAVTVPSAQRTLVLGTYLGLAPRGRQATLAPLRWPNKDPGETLDFSLDLTSTMADQPGDEIAFAVPAITPVGFGGLQVKAQSIAAPLITFWLWQGIAGQDYELSVSIVFKSGKVLRPLVSLFVGPPVSLAAANLTGSC